MSFGSRLKQLRIEKNLRQEDLSKIIGVHRATIGKYETNERFPDRDTLEHIADFFDVSIDYLLGRTDIRNIYNNTDIETSIEDEMISIKELLAFIKEYRNKNK